MAVCFQAVLGAALVRWHGGTLELAGCRGCIGMYAAGAEYDPGGVAQMLAPKAGRPRQPVQDNGKQNTYFSLTG